MFLEVFIQGAVVIIHGMPMNRSVGMHMSGDMTMCQTFVVGMIMRQAVVIVAVATCRGLRRRNKRPLQRKSQRCRHHDDDGETP